MTRLWGEILTAGGLIAGSVYVLIVASEFPAAGDTLPVFCAGGVIILSFFMVVEALWRRRAVLQEKIPFSLSYATLKPYILLVISIIYIPVIFELGYFTATFIFFVVATLAIGVRNYRAIGLTILILFPAMYAFFELFLQARLPTGLFI
jgi:hypothetical protein